MCPYIFALCPWGRIMRPKGIVSRKQGRAMCPKGIIQRPLGIALRKRGHALRPLGIVPCPSGQGLPKQGIVVCPWLKRTYGRGLNSLVYKRFSAKYLVGGLNYLSACLCFVNAKKQLRIRLFCMFGILKGNKLNYSIYASFMLYRSSDYTYNLVQQSQPFEKGLAFFFEKLVV